MKKVILMISMLVMSAPTFAEGYGEGLMMTVPDVALKVGGSFHDGDARSVTAVTIELQERECYHKAHCFNGSLMWLFSQGSTSPFGEASVDINIGAGLDYKYNFPKNQKSGAFLTAGPVMFIEPLRDKDAPKINFHVGAGIEAHGVLISLDAYGDPLNLRDGTPLYLLSGGYRF